MSPMCLAFVTHIPNTIDVKKMTTYFCAAPISQELFPEFEVCEAQGLADAREKVRTRPNLAAVVAGLRLGDGSGEDLLHELGENRPWMGRVLVAGGRLGLADADVVVQSPWRRGEIVTAVGKAMRVATDVLLITAE